MANKKLGWFPIWRSLLEHPIWTSNKPFDERSAWIDLIALMNHEDAKVQIGMNFITIKAGQHFTSIVKLADRWHWSKNKVYRFLEMLERDGMVNKDATLNGTLITLANYSNFALQGNTNETPNESTDRTWADQRTDHRTEHKQEHNNDKELKEQKKSPAAPPIVPPSDGGEWQ